MSAKTLLEHVGQLLFKGLKIGEKAAVVAEPIVDLVFPEIGALFNNTVNEVAMAQAAGEAAASLGAGNLDSQKAASVIKAIQPQINAIAAKLGLPANDATTAQKWNDAVVLALEAFQAPVAGTASGVLTPVPVVPGK